MLVAVNAALISLTSLPIPEQPKRREGLSDHAALLIDLEHKKAC